MMAADGWERGSYVSPDAPTVTVRQQGDRVRVVQFDGEPERVADVFAAASAWLGKHADPALVGVCLTYNEGSGAYGLQVSVTVGDDAGAVSGRRLP